MIDKLLHFETMTQHTTLNQHLQRLGLKCRGTGNRLTRKILDGNETVFEGTAQDVWQWLRDSGRLPYKREPSPRQKLWRAMRDPDRWVCRIVYQDKAGRFTARTISPVRFTANDRCVLALCIGREENRQFVVSQIKSVAMVNAAEVLMGSETVEEIDAAIQ